MKPFTEKQRQWVWFLSLWMLGAVAFLAAAYCMRWIMAQLL